MMKKLLLFATLTLSIIVIDMPISLQAAEKEKVKQYTDTYKLLNLFGTWKTRFSRIES